MKNAKELTVIYQSALLKKVEKMKKEALEFLDKNIAPKMEEHANEGDYGYSCVIDPTICIETIITELEKNDYKVNRAGRKLSISWL